ncbi:C39 family peptidase [Noviherbaspirillum denitrificans]|uniref:Peptidase C39 family protein n=1 Tax=Noviherbaspirillum denitrificans TaxID=1968433 RepID=A0A254TEF5_9BURK|nr:C39 family peptidase [Noviherbaspirillum denitrificans]OWW21036.1 peptidase C39 family protein [Noviherbaspirillum denitrificans]
MFVILLGALAFGIAQAGIAERFEVKDRPEGQYELPQSMVGGARITEPVRIEPYSQLKFQNIVRQAYDYSCGSAALVTLLVNYLGLDVNEQQAMEGMLERGEKEKIIERRGFSLLDMKRYVASLGIESGGFRAEVKDLLALDHPAIVPIDYAGFKHFVVFRGIRDELVYLADPSAGNIVLSVDEFASLWDRNTLFVLYPQKNRPALGKLALTDRELGVFDMDRVRDQANLQPLGNAYLMERAVNSGFGGVYLRRN